MATTIEWEAAISGDTALDRRQCEDIGAELARLREARGLSVDEVGDALLLSTRQVRALEQVDFAAFHNAFFYIGGLKKYARLVEVDPALVARATLSTAPDPTVALDGPPLQESSDPVALPARRAPRALALAVLLLAAGSGAYALWPRTAVAPRPRAPAPSISRPAAAAAVAAEPAAGPATTGGSDTPPVAAPAAAAQDSAAVAPGEPTEAGVGPFGVVRVERRTWVFVRSAEGAEVERTLPDQGWMPLDSEPAYLAVGSPDAVLTISGRVVDTAPFVVNGQIRMRGTDFDGLLTRGSAPPSR